MGCDAELKEQIGYNPMRGMLLELWLVTLKQKIEEDPELAIRFIEDQLDRLKAFNDAN